MKHSVPHDLEQGLARKTVEKALLSYREKYPQASVDLAWADESTARLQIGMKGMEIKGTLAIAQRAFVFDFNVPLLLRPFQTKAVSVIEREVLAWIDKARSGELA